MHIRSKVPLATTRNVIMTRLATEEPIKPVADEDDVAALPLCVDLDGTLVRTDTLFESVFVTLAEPRFWAAALRSLVIGRAAFKRRMIELASPDPALLPYNVPLLAYLRAQKAIGRRLVLATAADMKLARAVADHLGLFDEVIASDGVVNLRGATKSEMLCKRFGEKGFVYAGNDATDHAVWARAAGVIVVNAGFFVRRAAKARYPISATIDDRPRKLRAAIAALRPYQWVKNLLAFVPLFASGDFADLNGWRATIEIFGAFCAIASAIYILNDISDLAADRSHPRKSRRPFASGTLSIVEGLYMVPFLLALAVVLGWQSGALATLAFYGALAIAYNVKLKEMPLIDIFVLAALYTVRLFGGGEASGHSVSLWLLAFSSFLFLSLALIKRVSELSHMQTERHKGLMRRGYYGEDLIFLQMMGCASTFASALVLSLYIQSDIASHAYARPSLLWGIIPLMLFWQCRLWLSTARGYMDDDPIVYAARDWVSWLVFVCLVGFALAAYLP